jgi:hypothetical protein
MTEISNSLQLKIIEAGLIAIVSKGGKQIQLRGNGRTITVFPDGGRAGPSVYVGGVTGRYPGTKNMTEEQALALAIELGSARCTAAKKPVSGNSLDEINAELAMERNRKDEDRKQ